MNFSQIIEYVKQILKITMDDKYFLIYVFVIAFLTNFLRIKQIANARVSLWRKIAAYILEFMHNLYISGIIVTIVWLNVKSLLFGIYNIYSLVVLNIGILFAFLLFTYLRTCIFFLFFNRTLNYHDCGQYNSIVDVFHGNNIIKHGKPNCNINMSKWMTGIRILTFLVIFLDILYAEHYFPIGTQDFLPFGQKSS